MPINEKRVQYMAEQVAENAGVAWDEVPAIQQFLIREQALMWEGFVSDYNALNNIVEAEVSDSIFGFGEDEDE